MKRKTIKSFCIAIAAASAAAMAMPVFAAQNGETSEAGVHNVKYAKVIEAETVTPTETVRNDLPPIKYDFMAKLTLLFNSGLLDYGEEDGEYGFVTLPDGTKCLEVRYSDFKIGYQKYRFMPYNRDTRMSADYKYMRVTYMTESTENAKMTIKNLGMQTEMVTLVQNTAASGGKWVRSDAAYIGETGILDRFIKNGHNGIEIWCQTPGQKFYIKEIAFFTSREQAYEHYGEKVPADYVALTFGEGGTGGVLKGDDWGVSEIDNTDKVLHITYAEKTNHGINYMAKAAFNAELRANISHDYRYARVYYAAKNPVGSIGVDLYMTNDGSGERIALAENISDTDGEFVMSETVCLSDAMVNRLYSSHISYNTNAALKDGKYSIKAIYFFKSRAEADAFVPDENRHTVTINGNDISKYRIVVKEGVRSVEGAAAAIVTRVKALTGITLPVVYDSTAESEFEILLGLSNRKETTEGLGRLPDKEDRFADYTAFISGNKLVITAENYYSVADAVDTFVGTYLYGGIDNVPEVIEIGSDFAYGGASSRLARYDKWDKIENVSAPETFTEDFDTDDGYFTESNGEKNWRYEGGEYKSAVTDKRTVSYVHVWDANVTLGAKIKYSKAAYNGDMGVMLRYTADSAYLRAGYDFALGEWYVEYREGDDFAAHRVASQKANVAANTVYELVFSADADKAHLTVNGATILTAHGIPYVTPGRIAVYAENAAVCVDDVEAVFMSGMGTVMRNVSHTRLPDEIYREGGSVMELSDGTLLYESQHYGTAFTSKDSGKTWQREETLLFPLNNAYPGYLRLIDGTWITTVKTVVDGKPVVMSRTSSDDGKTWQNGGIITSQVIPAGNSFESEARALNMNDKITQSAVTGRIFFCQGFEVSNRARPNNGRINFGVFFYSDDNGKTWTESETGTWEIPGNETEEWFGESKILQCADGTLRMYNSWNDYGCIVYSESKDNGVTWGPIVTLPEFICAKSSMQFCRDPYAENDTTYYMVWVNSKQEEGTSGAGATMTRGRLSLAKTTDGKNWEYIGDIWHWRMDYKYINILAHVVDPFVAATKDSILVGCGLAEYLPVYGDGSDGHGAQRQHIWTIDRETVDETAKTVNKFTDIDMGAPYYEAVTFAYENNLFKGTSETEFSPSTVMDRAMFVTVLGRLDGVDVTKYVTPTFRDVKPGEWYTSYVEWAAANGIVNGMGDGSFGIGGSITVEQACTVLARYNGFKKSSVGESKTLSDYSDALSVSPWACEGVRWAVSNGIYMGSAGKLQPTSAASRGTVAKMFYNYVKAFAGKEIK